MSDITNKIEQMNHTYDNELSDREYVYFQVHSPNKDAFRALAPQDLLDQLDKKDGVFGIGAAKKNKTGTRPVAILLFSMDGEDDEPDSPEERCVRHMWINVEENNRGKGIGTALMDYFLKSLVRLSPCRVVIDIPKGDDREWMLVFYGKFSFLFIDSLIYEFTAPLSRIAKPKTLTMEVAAGTGAGNISTGSAGTGAGSISTEAAGKFASAAVAGNIMATGSAGTGSGSISTGAAGTTVSAAADHKQALLTYLDMLPPKRRRKILSKYPFWDLMISVLAFEGKNPVGCFMILRHASGTLEPALLDVMDGRDEQILPMLREALRLAQYRCKGNTDVHIRCDDEKTQMLCAELYPNLHPLQYWRGECLIRVEYKK